MQDDVSKRASVQLTQIQKFVSSGKRKIRGLASSVRPDRVGDIVEPKGGTWNLPVPLLWQHSHKDPVGWVRSIDIRHGGLWIEAEFAEGVGRADEVWAMVEAGLIDNFSIGFRSIEWKPLPSGGKHFTSWELLEVSCVVVPAQPEARISRGNGAGGAIKLIPASQPPIRIVRPEGGIPLGPKVAPRPAVPLVKVQKPIKLKLPNGAIDLRAYR